jgi:hypothetical protein
MDDAQPTSEPRNSPRQRSLMGASLSFHNGRSTVDCLVRNISESGARLSVSPAVSLPQTIELLIPQKGMTRAARVVWRSESEVGVAFAVTSCGSEKAPNHESTLKRRIRELEREVGQLRTRVLELSAG